MSRHDTDVVGFFFGVCFLVCAGLAIGVRTGNLGFASDGPDGAWIAGALLAVVGLIGVVGTLSGLRRRGTTGEPAAVTPSDLFAGSATATRPAPSTAPQPSGPEPEEFDATAPDAGGPGSAGRDLDADQTQVLDPPDPVQE